MEARSPLRGSIDQPNATDLPRQNATAALTHLDQLESESIHILREAAAESDNPVMLYSIGKDSSVLLHLALKAFYRRGRRFRCCTSIRFREMIAFRDTRAANSTSS